MDKKRLLYALGFVIICILLGYTIYRVFFKSSQSPIPSTPTPGRSGEFPNVGENIIPGSTVTQPGTLPSSDTRPGTTIPGGQTGIGQQGQQTFVNVERPILSQVTDVPTISAYPGTTGKGARFYNSQDGKFYRVDDQGNIVALSDKIFYNVSQVTWSPSLNESIIEYPDGSNIYYNFDTNEQVTLPKHWEEFSFSKAGHEIAAKSIGLSPENRWLIASDPRGNDIKLIEPLGNNANKVTVDWSPNQQVVAFSRTGQALGSQREEVLLVGKNQENFKSLIVEGRGFEPQWSPQGNKLLHSVYSGRSDFKPELWIVNATPDAAGQNRKLLNVNTWAHKCTMADERYAYCGVPESLETGAGFAPEIANNTNDRLYKIDVTSGIKTEIPLEGYMTVDSIFTSSDGSTLYITNKHQDGIFQISIK